MSDTHKAPSGQTFWQRKLQGYHTILIRSQLRIEESCLVQILSHLHLLRWLLFFSRYSLSFLFISSRHFCHRCCRFCHHHMRFISHNLPRQYRCISSSPKRTAIIRGEDIFVEVTKSQLIHLCRFPTLAGYRRIAIVCQMSPRRIGEW